MQTKNILDMNRKNAIEINKNMPFVSIVIPTLLLEPAYLQNCLDSLQGMDYKGLFEVIVVVNDVNRQKNSNLDGLVNKNLVCREFENEFSKLNLKFIYLDENRGFAEAVNIGLDMATGDYLALLNDDTVVDESWLSEMIKTINECPLDESLERKCDMVASVIYSPKEQFLSNDKNDKKNDDSSENRVSKQECKNRKPMPSTLDRVLEQVKENKWKIDSLGFDYETKGKATAITPFISSKGIKSQPFGPDAAAALYSRELVDKMKDEKTGVFDKKFFAYLEDVDLAYRASSAGYWCCLADKAVVYHFKHSTSSSMSRFKVKQDMVNWWRLVLKNYEFHDWISHGFSILLERGKNFSGFLKSYF